MIGQGTLPTVGDTITIVRRIVAAPGAVVEARAPADSAIATLVAPPVLTREGDSVSIAYTVAMWSAGHNDVVFPGAIVIDARGRVDTLADAHVPVEVASVLPGKTSGTTTPHAARPWLVRGDRSILPFVVLVPLALLLAGFLQWRWRRHGPELQTAAAEPAAPGLTEARIRAWLAAGESRLVLAHLDAALRNQSGAADWRDRAAAVRYAAGNEPAVSELIREGSRLAAALLDAEPGVGQKSGA